MEVRTTGVPVIGARELRRAADILRRYKQGKQNLERRIIADEDWWKLRQWRQFSDKGNPNDDRPASGWLFNVIMGKHADAVAAYPGPVIRPREPDDRQEAQMLSSIIPCILEQNDFEEVYSVLAEDEAGHGRVGRVLGSGEAWRTGGYLHPACECAESVLGAGRDGYPEVAECVLSGTGGQ